MNINLSLFAQAAASRSSSGSRSSSCGRRSPRHRAAAEEDRRWPGRRRARQAGSGACVQARRRVIREAEEQAQEIIAPGREARCPAGRGSQDQAKAEGDRIIAGGQGRDRAGSLARQGNAARPGCGTGGPGRGEDLAPRSGRQGPRRPAQRCSGGALRQQLERTWPNSSPSPVPTRRRFQPTPRPKGQLAQWSDMLALLADVYQDAQMQAVLANPQLTKDDIERMLLACAVTSSTAPLAICSILLVRNDRLDALPRIRDLFEQLKSEYENVVEAQIESAFPLSEEQLACWCEAGGTHRAQGEAERDRRAGAHRRGQGADRRRSVGCLGARPARYHGHALLTRRGYEGRTSNRSHHAAECV